MCVPIILGARLYLHVSTWEPKMFFGTYTCIEDSGSQTPKIFFVLALFSIRLYKLNLMENDVYYCPNEISRGPHGVLFLLFAFI